MPHKLTILNTRLVDKSFEALHVVNKRAKLYQREPNEKAHLRADALYGLKHEALLNWKDHVEKVEKHYIRNDVYYCFYYDNWSFHIPVSVAPRNISYLRERVLYDFESHSAPRNGNYNEKDALTHLYQEHDLNANNYITHEAPFNSYWSYLPNR